MAVSTEGDDFMADTSEESPVSLPGSDSDQDDHVAIENAIQAYVPKELAPPGPVDFMEVFSPPRIWPHAERLGLRCGPSVDIETGFDLLTDLGREACMKLIYNLQPAVIMLSRRAQSSLSFRKPTSIVAGITRHGTGNTKTVSNYGNLHSLYFGVNLQLVAVPCLNTPGSRHRGLCLVPWISFVATPRWSPMSLINVFMD